MMDSLRSAVRALLVAALLAAAGCTAPAADLTVELETDVVAPDEFSSVAVVVTRLGAASPTRREVVPTSELTGELLEGVRVAELLGLEPGTMIVEVQLLDPGGRMVIGRRIAADVRGRTVLRVVVTRSCLGVVCPGGGDDPDATECLGARCVPPECSAETPEACGTPECRADADCTGPACTERTCADGACLVSPDDALCGGGRCDPDTGCTASCTATSCDDGNPCTDDACTGAGCTSAANTLRCDDGVFCNGPDTCAATTCSAHDGDPCTSPTTCDETEGACTGCGTSDDCPEPIDGPWSACGAFSDGCDESGTSTRTVTTFACTGGVCVGSDAPEEGACTRSTEGAGCGLAGATCMGAICTCPFGPFESLCGEGIDQDCDGAIDCADSDCAGLACSLTGRVCASSSCACPGGATETACGGGVDDDCDGAADCADTDCAGASCGPGRTCAGTGCGCAGGMAETLCGDGLDDDCDAIIDCADGDCDGLSCGGAGQVCDSGACTCEGGAPTEITSFVPVRGAPIVLSAGGEFHVVYMGGPVGGSMDYYLARLSAAGVQIGSAVALTTTGVSHPPHAAFDGAAYGMSWTVGNSEIDFQRFEADGTLLFSRVPVAIGPVSNLWASIAWSPTLSRFGVAWASGTSFGDLDPTFREVDSWGGLLGAQSTVVTTPAGCDTTDTVWAGDRFAVAWHEARGPTIQVYLATLDATGRDLDGDSLVSTGSVSGHSVRLAWTGTTIGAVWQDGRDGNDEIYFATVSPSGDVGANRRVTTAAGASQRPSIVWTGGRFAVAFADAASGTSQITLLELDTDGAPLGAGQVLSCAPSGAVTAAIGWNGTSYGVAWLEPIRDTFRLMFRTITP